MSSRPAVSLALASLAALGCRGDRAPSRDAVVARVADLVRITNPEGIDTLEALTIGGVTQWISIRGRDRANPVLLFVHGGPANPTMPIGWAFQKPWEDYFTVVQWDQRGSGKSAFPEAQRDRFAATMTLDQIVADGLELVDTLRHRLGQPKVVVMGWSWGTAVGARMALRRPDGIHAFVGLGQAVAASSERIGYDRVLALARAANHEEAVRELEALAPYPGPGNSRLLAGVGTMRKWARFFDGGWYGRPDLRLYDALPEWAPEYSAADLAAQESAGQWAQGFLLRDLISRDLRDEGRSYRVPVIFLMGRLDLHTPIEPVEEYLDWIEAPVKQLVRFEKSGHFTMFEEPGRLLVTLVNEVLPLTGDRRP
jgi:pimeloyl-ACP methyl ester carboxylesterase